MAHHRAVLLRQAADIEHGAAFAFEMRRHAEERAQRDDAGAADAGDEDAIGPLQRRRFRLRQTSKQTVVRRKSAELARDGAAHGDKARAKALEAGKILVAARLVDAALAAEFGLDRHYRDAVRFIRAIAAALAHRVVDEDALGRIGKFAALAAAAFFRGAGLIVDQHGEAFDVAQLALHGVEIVAMADGDAGGKAGALRIFARLVGYDDDAARAFGQHLLCDLRHGHRAFDRLAAGHGDRVVVENFVGDVDAGGGSGADRRQAAMRVSAVAEILENVALGGERRLADPVDAFAAHMGQRGGMTVGHEQRHAVTADAGHGAAAVRHPRRGVVRTARAEKRRALDARRRWRRPLEGFEPREALVELGRVAEPLQARDDGARHHGRSQLAGTGKKDRAGLVGLADDVRPARRLDIVEELYQLVLDEAALLLDDQNILEVLREGQRALRLERPR